DDINAPRSLGAIHDSGTGSGDGSGGIFGVMPVVCPGDDFYKCLTTVEARKIIRAKNKDAACPGYFTTTLNNSITMETTTTRQAGLQRYTSYFDGLYCTWDTFRTEFPFLSLTSPDDFRNIVDNYIDGASATGFVPECRANMVPGLTQGGDNGLNVISHYIVKYGYSSLAFTKEQILAQLTKES
ncbi:unnamed protein product, partial [Tilletia controversa]